MTRLLVPIDLDALVERVPGEVYAEVRFATPDRTVTKPTRQTVAPAPFADAGPRAPGVHLLWALPDALARFDQRRRRFPRLPCRWLIVRTSAGQAPGSRLVRAWVLADIHRPTVPVVELPGRIPAVAGPAQLDITGPDRVDPSWFAFYDNVADRLAFHDDLSDTPSGPLNYLVCGWYQRRTNDPLRAGGQPASESALRERLAALGWSLSGAVPSLPTDCLFHGAVAAVGWPAPGWPGDGRGTLAAEVDRRPDPASVEIGLGERMAAVLGDLLTDDEPEAGPLVELLVGGEIAELDAPGGEFRAARQAHRDRFAVASTPDNEREVVFTPAGLAEPSEQQAAPTDASPLDSGQLTVVSVPKPRSYIPLDPQIVLAGAGRSYRHGEDGRFDPLGVLTCRLPGDTMTVLGRPDHDDGHGRDVLPRRSTGRLDLPTSSLPRSVREDVEALLVELQALDPAVCDADPSDPEPHPLAALRLAWLRAQAQVALAGVTPTESVPPARADGVPPAPVAISLPAREWDPLVLDWTVHWTPSARGVHDWALDDLDFEPQGPAPEPGGAPVVGRTILTSAPARTLADAIDRAAATLEPGSSGAAAELVDALVTAFGAVDRADLVARLRHADLVGARLDGFLARLRGVPVGTWIGASGIVGDPAVIAAAERAEQYVSTPLVAGTYTVGRLRLVDAFGRTLLLEPGTPTLTLTTDVRHPGDDQVALQRPRFTAPTTLEFRYIDAQATGDLSQADVTSAGRPLAGFLVPNLFDSTLELHDAAGEPLGLLGLGATNRALWLGTPGVQERAGLPAVVVIGTGTAAQRLLTGVVDGILAADANRTGTDPAASALTELTHAIDVARYAVDTRGGIGDRYLQALLGSPALLLRAHARIRIDDPQAPTDRPVSVPARLGSFGEIRDGLLCFYLAADPGQLRLVHPAQRAGGGVPRPGAPDASGVVWLRQDADVDLLVVMTPGSDITISSGLTPAKVISMVREWFDHSMSRLTPTLRFDAVVRDQGAIRIPVSADAHGDWLWNHRAGADRWVVEPVRPGEPGQLDPARPPVVEDGYLRLALLPDEGYAENEYRIVAIHRGGTSRRIEMLRVRSALGEVTDLHIEEAVGMAQSGRFAFITRVEGFPEVRVVVDATRAGRLFLRTDADQTTGNNLSSLPMF